MILTFEELRHELDNCGGSVVQCHGCFDLLHVGHVKHLMEANKFGDNLVVTITPDRYINKGSGRPVYNEKERAEIVDSIGCVDYVIINEWPDARCAITEVQPQFYVKGIDYEYDDNPDLMLEKEIECVRNCGGEIMYTYSPKYSTTDIIKRIKETC